MEPVEDDYQPVQEEAEYVPEETN
jgi:hypothetical protein